MKYLIDTKAAQKSRNIVQPLLRREILQHRPTSWRVFLSAVFRRNKNLVFVELPDRHVRAFFQSSIFSLYMGGKLLINGNKYDTIPFNFWTLCQFCLESLQTGLFFRFWRWHW